MNNGVIQDDSADSWDGNAKSEDYWGYLWDQPIYFDHVTYHTGNMFWDGGWFLDLRVQYTEDGATWIDVPTRISPEYDFTDQREGREPYERYDLYIPTLRGTGIRIYGTPGGMATFTSISELEVFGDQATVRPLVVQGIDAVVPERSTATLDGSLSFSTKGPLSGFAWVQTGGPTVAITDSDKAVATFTTPGVDADTALTFEFTAGDGTDTDTDEVAITVKNLLTAAVAGIDQRVYEGTPVTLDGTGSTTTSGNITYSWTQTEGTEATLTGANTATPSFTAPAVWDYNDDLIFQLEVDDGVAGVSTDTVTVNVKNMMESDIPGDPWGLKAEDIYAATLVPGETTYDGQSDTYTVTADGSDIWGTADNFRYLYLEAFGDFSVSVCMVSPFPPSTYIYAKAGVMVRQNNTPGSAEVHQVSTWQTGGEFQWRDSQGAATDWTGVAEPPHPLSHPFWVRIRREGNTWYGDYSYDGDNWEHQAAAQHELSMADPVLVGICLCSNEPGFLTTVEFSDFRVNDQGPPRPTILPDAYAVRTLPAGYEAGATADTSLSVRINPDNPPDTVTVAENIPTGLSVVPGSVTHGGIIVGNTIAWTLTGGGVTELAYSLNVPGDASGALNFAGSVSFPGTTVDIYGDDIVYEVPSAPENLAVDMLIAGHLSWSASSQEGVVGYRVYRSANGQAWEEVGAATGSSYFDAAVVAGNTYSYRVAAVNAAGEEGPLSTPTDEKMITLEIREAEDFNYGGGLWPWTADVTIPALDGSSADDLDPGNDFWHPNKGGPKDYRPLDDIGIWEVPVYGVPGRGIGWISPDSWWRYTFDVPAPGAGDPEGGWVKLIFRVDWPWLTTFAAYWDETFVGTITFTTGGWHIFTDISLEQFQTTPGLHTLRVEARGDDPNVDVLDFDKIGIGFNWSPPTREPIFEDDFEDYTNLYG
ncbi:hypothetical protein HQ563_18605, partial [bacterium]|nr:hypothetical protein [bacterium]